MSESRDPPQNGLTAAEAAELAEAAAKAAAEKAAAAKAAAEAEATREYEEAKAAVRAVTAAKAPTDKRSQERIFRREMGEPEFFLYKRELAPPRRVLTEEEEEEISRNVEIPKDQTPLYDPKHILTPEFAGTSNYESGIAELVNQTKHRLDYLRSNPQLNAEEIARAEQTLIHLDSLYQNYYYGMNVFRTAKGGRDKIHA